MTSGSGRRWWWLPLVLLVLAGCGIDADQAYLCRKLIPAFESVPDQVRVLRERPEPGDARTLSVDYQVDGQAHWIACRFAGRFFDVGRHELVGVATDRAGVLKPMQLAMLRLWAGLPPPRAVGTAGQPVAPSPWLPVLFLFQQVINAVTVACVYGLLAVGYTLIYGILGQINLAMGELTMLGALVAAMAMAGLGMGGVQALAPALVAVLALSMLVGAAYGWTMDRLVFRRLRGVRSHTPLIAAVGLAIAMQEGTRLLQGAREWWPQPVFAERHDLLQAGGFTLTALTSQVIILGLAGAFAAGLWWIMHRTAFGRSHRACADHLPTAELLGVHVPRTVALTFVVGGACAGAAGCVIALYYGGVNFYTGYQVGFKALAAAVVGGIGSVPGALLGGALLGIVETFWSGYFAIAYKDIVAFGLLTLFLIYRPDGIMGVPPSRGD